MLYCDYEIVIDNGSELIIRDKNLGRRSVTNDIENVIAFLLPRLRDRRFGYYDSDGEFFYVEYNENGFISWNYAENEPRSEKEKATMNKTKKELLDTIGILENIADKLVGIDVGDLTNAEKDIVAELFHVKIVQIDGITVVRGEGHSKYVRPDRVQPNRR